MNRRQNELSGIGGIPRRVANWLQSLAQNRPAESELPVQIAPARPPAAPAQNSEPELLQKAAECYARAGWADDACRVFEQMGDDRHAAPYHEQQGRFRQAALCYARVSDWQNAARCYLRNNQPDDAAECLAKGGQLLQAAWVWADLAHHYRHAITMLRDFTPTSETDRMAFELVIARCEAGTEAPTRAARRLSQVVAQLRTLSSDYTYRRLSEWGFAVATALRRPDLIVHLHTASVITGVPNAYEQWETWAKDTLGNATGLPLLKQDNPEAS